MNSLRATCTLLLPAATEVEAEMLVAMAQVTEVVAVTATVAVAMPEGIVTAMPGVTGVETAVALIAVKGEPGRTVTYIRLVQTLISTVWGKIKIL